MISFEALLQHEKSLLKFSCLDSAHIFFDQLRKFNLTCSKSALVSVGGHPMTPATPTDVRGMPDIPVVAGVVGHTCPHFLSSATSIADDAPSGVTA